MKTLYAWCIALCMFQLLSLGCNPEDRNNTGNTGPDTSNSVVETTGSGSYATLASGELPDIDYGFICRSYRVVDTAETTGYSGLVYDVNIHGDLVGITENNALGSKLKNMPFLIQDEIVTEFMEKYTAINLINVVAVGINDNGLIIGYGEEDNFDAVKHAVHWTKDGAMGILDNGNDDSEATDVNNHGFVVGWTEAFSIEAMGYVKTAYLWKVSGETSSTETLPLLDSAPIGSFSSATGINNSDVIVGYIDVGNDGEVPVYWAMNELNEYEAVEIATLAGGTGRAISINDDGKMFGQSTNELGQTVPVVWTDKDTIESIPLLDGDVKMKSGQAYAANNQGTVVGWDEPEDGTLEYRGWVYKDGIKTDLNDLISPKVKLHMAETFGINEAGHITGRAYFGGQSRGVQLIPQECE